MNSAPLAGLFDQPGGALLGALFAATWKGALVVLLVLAVQGLLAPRLPPRWRYALWLLAAVRLMMPVGPPSPLSLFRVGTGGGSPLPGLGELTAAAGGAAPAAGRAGFGLGLAAALLGVWALGLVAIAVRRGVARRHLGRLLSRTREVGGRDPEAALLERCRETLGVRRDVRLVESAALAAPALWPGGPSSAPAILVPAARWRSWSEDELRYVLLHELAHLRQGDGTARRLEGLLTALHWFNPLVWLAAHRARADREPACDALVLSRLGAAERAGYGQALIRAAVGARAQLPLPGLVGMADRAHLLRRRISMIAHPQPSSVRRAVALAAMAAVLAVASWTDVGTLAAPAGDGAPPDPGDDERLEASVQREREIGVAMFSWLTDRLGSEPCPEVDTTRPTNSVGRPSTEAGAVIDGRLDWSRCPRITHEQLAAILVPSYLGDLPVSDPWGHPLEFCLNLKNTCDPAFIVGVRSPGRDGRWDGDHYPVGRFDPDDVDRDLVWIDGFFVTWPEAEVGGHAENKPSDEDRRAWRSDS